MTRASRAAGVLTGFGLSLGLGFLIAVTNLGAVVSKPTVGAELALTSFGLISLLALRARTGTTIELGPGVWMAVMALSFASVLGVASGDDRITTHRTEVVALFALSVASLVAGAALAAAFGRARVPIDYQRKWISDPFDSPLVKATVLAGLLLAIVNLATGDVPLFAPNIDAARFAGSGGLFGRLWIWVIGAVEAGIVIWFLRRRAGLRDRFGTAVAGTGVIILVLLAGRSFLLIVGLAVLVALAFEGRLSRRRLVVLAAAGLLILGFGGSARISHSDPTGARRAYLQSHHINGIFGLLSQSVATGPFVLANTLDNVPGAIPFQHGRFLLRDVRATMPFHPFGQPDRADVWVTRTILRRDAAQIGGSPPTLAGGLYIDFGLPGVVVGSALLGFLLVLLYRWARVARTIGSLALYSYSAAYVALAAYSYVSLKPTLVAVAGIALLAHWFERGSDVDQGN
jgi:oligosaccharide repeat unit polymerase